MVVCRTLHWRLLHLCFREVQAETRVAQMQPFEFGVLVEATAFLRPSHMPAAFVDFLGAAVSQFHRFKPQDLAALMWALLRLSEHSVDEFETVFAASTTALAQHSVTLPQWPA